jgi:hypothetical protein
MLVKVQDVIDVIEKRNTAWTSLEIKSLLLKLALREQEGSGSSLRVESLRP